MMKKLVAIILAGTLVLGCSVTAFANSSVGTAEQASITVSDTATVDATGTSVDVVVSQEYDTEEQKQVADEMALAPEETLNTLLEETGEAELDFSDLGDVELTKEEAKELVFKAVMDVKPVGDRDKIVWPVTIRFQVPGVRDGSKVLVLHYYNGKWETKAVKIGHGYVDVQFDHLSPVAIYVDQETVDRANDSAGVSASTVSGGSSSSDSDSSSDTSTSPETGEFPLARALGVVAAAAIIGIVVVQRRRYTEV